MNHVALHEILPLVVYETVRAARRQEIIALKRTRRVALGDCISLVFENHDTVLHQVHEMLRAEQITDPAKVQEEIDTYNAILPRRDELAATLFIELTNAATIEGDLDRFVGLDRNSVFLHAGACPPVPAIFEDGHATDTRIAAVHFVRFPLPAATAERVRSSDDDVFLQVRHPACTVTERVSAPLRAALRADLAHDA